MLNAIGFFSAFFRKISAFSGFFYVQSGFFLSKNVGNTGCKAGVGGQIRHVKTTKTTVTLRRH